MKKNFKFDLLLLFVLGCLTSLSLPPLNFFLLNFITLSFFFIFLFKKLDQQLPKKYFFYYGWFFGFGYFLTSLYWITISLTFDKNFSFLIPISLILIPSFLALFYGLISFIFYLFKPKNILSAFFLLSLLFGIIEFIRGTILTGFPWNLIVYSFSESLDFISVISYIGTYSLNLITISFFILPGLFFLRNTKKDIVVCFLFLLLPIIFVGFGNFQKKSFLNYKIKENPYTIRVIGSNIDLERFYNNTNPEDIINELISISSPEKNRNILFIWPEGIIPYTYQDELELYNDLIKQHFDEHHLIVLGLISREIKDTEFNFYNSISVFDNNLKLISEYKKINLVPFGEFLPLEKILNKIGLKTITKNIGSFTKGKERKIIEIKKKDQSFKFLPLICYEIIYSGNLSKNFEFDFILNISEDGWFGKSIGPKQHFAHSIFRSIEHGKYLVRASNNGKAAIINPLGQIVKKIDYGKTGYIDFINRRDFKKTIFSTYGNKIFVILILLYIFLTFSFNRFRNE